ncbi:zinc transporter ZIP6 [Pseudophryne corroboree]|uniref:zinc transporter ZIP6 n=1 Tax=Pseudophryne corroboree TaxID=495146 RepID=UPI003081A2BA
MSRPAAAEGVSSNVALPLSGDSGPGPGDVTVTGGRVTERHRSLGMRMERGGCCTRGRMRPLIAFLVTAVFCRTSSGTEAAITVTLPPQGAEVFSPSNGQVSAFSPLPPAIDPVLATQTQRHNLLLLFQRYGENNQSLTVSGFRLLLRSLGVERLRNASRHTHRGGHHQQHHPHHDHHPHNDHPHHHHHHPHHPSSSTPHPGHSGACEESRRRRHVTSPEKPDGSPAAGDRAGSSNPDGAQVECLNASRLLMWHGMDMHMHLGAEEFAYICPAIINQIDRKSCVIHVHKESMAGSSQVVYSMKIAWIGGFIAITIISVLSLLGIILVPLMNRVFFKFLLSFLVALAVGTLSGDAFLHLLPHSHSKHYHSHGGFVDESHADEKAEESAHLDATWKGLTALGGLYFMFLVEHLITLIKQYKDKKQKNQKKAENEEELEIKKKLSNHSHIEEKEASDSGSHHESYTEGETQIGAHFQSQQPVAPEEEEEEIMIAQSHDETSYREYVSIGCENKCHSHFHDTLGQSDDLIHHHHDYHHILHHHHHQNHHPHSHSQRYSREELKDAGVATLAWMVIMGDGLHNFSDGLAIGAAFTEGLSSGLSTSVAVFCHELPHELGDFAILLKAGMTVKQAVLYNALSAMLAYLGMITGILIGQYAENISVWIFALTAGLFMYMAFVDMIPEMLHNDASDHGCSRWGYFLLQNAGILLGFFIMLVISIFEHKIVFTINL